MANFSFFSGIWINAFLINFLLIFLGQRFPFLTKKGWIHAGVLGTLLLGSIGWNGWISVCVYLLLGTLVQKLDTKPRLPEGLLKPEVVNVALKMFGGLQQQVAHSPY